MASEAFGESGDTAGGKEWWEKMWERAVAYRKHVVKRLPGLVTLDCVDVTERERDQAKEHDQVLFLTHFRVLFDARQNQYHRSPTHKPQSGLFSCEHYILRIRCEIVCMVHVILALVQLSLSSCLWGWCASGSFIFFALSEILMVK